MFINMLFIHYLSGGVFHCDLPLPGAHHSSDPRRHIAWLHEWHPLLHNAAVAHASQGISSDLHMIMLSCPARYKEHLKSNLDISAISDFSL